tara:strand:- start:107 stop:358 length:252 start_codon:yes stop_codon:yes gene_type:complete
MFRYVRELFRKLARGIRWHDAPRQTETRFVEEWTEKSIPKLVDAGYAQRLEEEERDQRPRTTKLSEQHERVGRKYQEIPDPWN